LSRTQPRSGVRKRRVAKVGSAVASSPDVPDGLDWQMFRAAYFPGRRRHDLEALTAYAAYRRSRALDERSSEADRIKEVTNSSPGSTALQGWEDEGGAAR
jgi:hypothetical protein